ncbi:hypothetical protein NOI24_26815 [Neorhizobium galegae]|uniref:hypothetical protein n=1 Tax=Neorhizobium galegae TaxID=399 RepID=UPI002103AD73|nr:hypothetical protein [Neorhizobium galegae]MCQ1774914.1 hypothetical protein [Neorhizobium galegae]MCQ1799426.1 hypothetical protein [Neorhizobium galegae]
MTDATDRRKLLIVERKLENNRGHHHTQVSALKMLLPEFDANVVAGESYDGFLGTAVGKLSAKSIKLARLRSRLQHGTAPQRFGALFGGLKLAHSVRLPSSAFGASLATICRQLQLGAADLIIVPTADLDSLESAVELATILADKAPRVCLRFLNSELGDRDERIRAKRLRAILRRLPANILLFTETEELADYFRNHFKMPVEGGFYLPCSVPATVVPDAQVNREPRFRIGVFGEPRPEKGSQRLANIVAALAELADTGSPLLIDFVIQGSAADFREGGIYGDLRGFLDGEQNIIVSPQDNRISPEEFVKLFHSVDAVLLPYERATYCLQGSGVVQDAVAGYKPVIHTRGMSMMALLTHGNGVPATTDREFAEAIAVVATDQGRFQQGTARAAAYFQDALATNPLLPLLGTSLQGR